MSNGESVGSRSAGITSPATSDITYQLASQVVSVALRAAGGHIPKQKRSGPLFHPSTRYLVTLIRHQVYWGFNPASFATFVKIVIQSE